MGKTVTFELFVGALSTLVALVSAILLGAVRNEHIFPHENMRSLAITAIIIIVVVNSYLHFAISRIDKNGSSRLLSHRAHPLAHLGLSFTILAFSLGIMLSKPYKYEEDRVYFDGPEFFFPTGPVEIDCCFFWGQVGLHLLSFIAVITNRIRAQNFKDAFGYDGYNDREAQRRHMAMDELDENGQRRPAPPKRVYVV